MTVISLLLVVVMHLLNVLPVRINLKRERIMCSRRVRGKKDEEKRRIWWQRSPNSERSRCPQLQAGFGPGNKATLPNSSEYRFCLHLHASVSFLHSVNSWILKCFRLKLPLFAAISYSRLSAWQLPETLVVGSSLPLQPSKIVGKWDKISLFSWHLWSD